MTKPRDEARLRILQANIHIVRRRRVMAPYIPPTLLSMRHIQRAVCIVRRFALVKPDVLVLAGFNPKSKLP